MAISYPIEFPMDDTIGFTNFSLQLDFAQATSESPFTLREQIFDYEAERWMLNVQYRPLRASEASEAKRIRAFILSLRGRVGTFKVGDPLNATPAGNVGSNLQVLGSPIKGSYSLSVKNLPVGAGGLNGSIKAGDDLEINSYLYTVLKDVSANGSGQATIDILPSLRTDLTDGTPIITTNPKGLFRLDDVRAGWSGTTERFYTIQFTGLEAI